MKQKQNHDVGDLPLREEGALHIMCQKCGRYPFSKIIEYDCPEYETADHVRVTLECRNCQREWVEYWTCTSREEIESVG